MRRETQFITWYQSIKAPETRFFSFFSLISSSLAISLYSIHHLHLLFSSLFMAALNAQPVERAFGVTNIKTHIPLTLYLEDHNYDAWRELLLMHCLAFDVLGHIDGTAIPANDDDTPWKKRDRLVKLWLYGTLAEPLFRSIFKTGGTARDIWLRIKNQFRNNKEARALQLDHDLRTTEIGDKSVHDYCQKLKSIFDLLENLDAPVADRTLVMYLLNGLNEKYDNIINVIKHKDPFPSFDNAKSMLLNEETRLKRGTKAPVSNNTPSSSTVLTVTTYKPQVNHPRSNRKQNNRDRGRSGFGNQRPWSNNWAPNWNQPWQQPFFPGAMMQWPQYPTPWTQPAARGLLGPTPQRSEQAHVANTQPQLTTDFAQSFNTMTLGDPGAAFATMFCFWIITLTSYGFILYDASLKFSQNLLTLLLL